MQITAAFAAPVAPQNLNSDFTQRVVAHAADAKWLPSPLPGASFARHVHGGGEEIMVLDGLFRDEAGNYPQGTWLRSPRFSQHAPFTCAEGALIYVKVSHLGAEF